MTTTATALRIPEDIAARYDNLARTTGRTRTFYLNKALAEGIGQLEYEYGILKQVEDYRAGRLETYSMEEVRAHCGLAD